MLPTRLVIPAISLCALLLATAAPASSVQSEYDPDVDFSSYSTYAWKEGTPAPTEEIEQRIVAAIDRELQAVGLEKVEGEADLYISTIAIASQRAAQSLTNPQASVRGWEWEQVDQQDVADGTLMAELVDGSSGARVWQGIAKRTFSGKKQRVPKKVDQLVRKLFRDFPRK